MQLVPQHTHTQLPTPQSPLPYNPSKTLILSHSSHSPTPFHNSSTPS
ncbi:hypothetical protein EVA_19235 [gut metagenome]|uniref:Uncharacterized protein n=1 Tax=gut metagenome TaxID=749906 RepID=J9FE22_9ZZZZ